MWSILRWLCGIRLCIDLPTEEPSCLFGSLWLVLKLLGLSTLFSYTCITLWFEVSCQLPLPNTESWLTSWVAASPMLYLPYAAVAYLLKSKSESKTDFCFKFLRALFVIISSVSRLLIALLLCFCNYEISSIWPLKFFVKSRVAYSSINSF